MPLKLTISRVSNDQLTFFLCLCAIIGGRGRQLNTASIILEDSYPTLCDTQTDRNSEDRVYANFLKHSVTHTTVGWGGVGTFCLHTSKGQNVSTYNQICGIKTQSILTPIEATVK
jgi:hypothetical protein